MAKVASKMSDAKTLAESLHELQAFFESQQWSYCLIGGLAVNRWGEPRFTGDIDIVVFAGIGEEERFVDKLLDAFPSRSERGAARQFALNNRVLLLRSSQGVPVDVSLGALGFEEEMMRRAQPVFIVGNERFNTASPEDVIVMKTIAGRAKDWKDIEGIIARQHAKLDWSHIYQNLGPLLESLEAPERANELESLRQRIESA